MKTFKINYCATDQRTDYDADVDVTYAHDDNDITHPEKTSVLLLNILTALVKTTLACSPKDCLLVTPKPIHRPSARRVGFFLTLDSNSAGQGGSGRVVVEAGDSGFR